MKMTMKLTLIMVSLLYNKIEIYDFEFLQVNHMKLNSMHSNDSTVDNNTNQQFLHPPGVSCCFEILDLCC